MSKKVIGWMLYSIIFTLLLIPFTGLDIRSFAGGVILGFFAGILNAIYQNSNKEE